MSEPGSEPNDPLERLQRLMRDDEAELAGRIASESDAALVLCDGPLAFVERKRSPVVGVIKRFARLYLEPEQDQLLTRLGPGERTPVFGIADPPAAPACMPATRGWSRCEHPGTITPTSSAARSQPSLV